MSVRLSTLLVLALALVLAACGGTAAPAPAATTAPDQTDASAGEATSPTVSDAPSVLRIGWAGSPDSLNPGLGVLEEAFTTYELVYDTMYNLNLDGTYSLELADAVDVSEDGTVYTYHIRDGVQFHDGTPLTAEDVAFTYNFYQANADFPFMPGYTEYFETVEATEGNNVVITLYEAIPNIESQLVFLYVLPKHIWESVENPSEFENTEMIGSGPFKLQEYRQSEFVHLVANENHILTPPKVDEVVFQTFENQDALVQAIKTGQVDMITEMPRTAAVTLRNDANVELVSGQPLSPTVGDIIFNQVSDENCPPDDGVCSGHPALRDVNVRRALAHATDKQKIIDVVLLGFGEPGVTLIPSGLGHWFNDTITDYPFDLAEANRILDEGGYADGDGDGVRETTDGQPLTFRLNWPSDSTSAPRQAEMLNEMWTQAGVKLELQALDPDALTSICCPTFDYDVILWGWGSDPDPNFLLGVHLGEEVASGFNETGYANPTFDEMFGQQATELDLATRRQIVWDMQQILFDDVVYIVPFYEEAVQAFRKDTFTGWITDQPKVGMQDVTSLVVVEPVK